MNKGIKTRKNKKTISSTGTGNYLIDQSGKIEHTAKPTVVALANGKAEEILEVIFGTKKGRRSQSG